MRPHEKRAEENRRRRTRAIGVEPITRDRDDRIVRRRRGSRCPTLRHRRMARRDEL